MSSKATIGGASARGTVRDVVAFLAAALVPAAALGLVGLRALRNEDAALRREASLTVERAAEHGARRIDDRWAAVTADLEGMRVEGGAEDEAALRATLERARNVVPPFAEMTVVSASGRMVLPRTTQKQESTEEEAACRRAVQALEVDAEEPRAIIVLQCPEARSESGRWLWPILATAELSDHADAELPARLVTWIEEHASKMKPTERAVTKKEIARVPLLDEKQRARIERALSTPAELSDDVVESVARSLRAEAAVRALRDVSSEGLVTWRGGGALGVLRALPEGGFVGFVATPETLDRALLGDASTVLDLSNELRARATSSNATSTSEQAVAWIADGLGVRVSFADPGALASKASRSERVIGGLVLGSVALAVALAALLYARMRAARQTSELRTSFVAAVSHELRTPLASIRMLAELLHEGRVEEDERAEVTEALAREAARLGDTVERFLGFARMAKGKLVAEREHVRVSTSLAERVDAFRERHPEASVVATLDEDLEADIDVGLMELVLDNLLENAHRYAPDGGPYTVELSKDGGDLVLCVSDRGPGIPKEDQRRIFEAFERGDDRLSKSTSGAGIGLSLVAHVARAHGGRAWVESDGGAKFFVRVPLRTAG